MTSEFSVWFEEAPWVTSIDVFDFLSREVTNGEVELGYFLDYAGLLFFHSTRFIAIHDKESGDDSVSFSPKVDACSDSSFPSMSKRS